MRRSAHVTAPLLASAAVAALSGYHAESVCTVPQACVEQHGETRVAGFGASFADHPVLWWFAAAGAIVIAGRFVSTGE